MQGRLYRLVQRTKRDGIWGNRERGDLLAELRCAHITVGLGLAHLIQQRLR